MSPDLGTGPQNVFAAAIEWLDGVLLGSVATAIAVIAVASIGFLLLSGRIDLKRAGQVVLGCFILFGASTIAAGLMAEFNGSAPVAVPPPSLPPPPTVPVVAKAAPASSAYDPYAGAAMPTH